MSGCHRSEHHQPGRRRERRRCGHRAAWPGQPAIGESAVGVGRVDAFDQVERRPDDGAVVSVEHHDLAEVRHHQQVARVENSWCGGHSDHRSAPPDPLRRREGHYRAGLADVEVVEAIKKRTGQATALDQPRAPSLAGVVVRLPHHQRAAARGLRIDGEIASRPQRHRGGQVALDRSRPFQPQVLGAWRGFEAAVGGVAVLGGPAGGGVCLHPGIGVPAAGQRTRDQRC